MPKYYDEDDLYDYDDYDDYEDQHDDRSYRDNSFQTSLLAPSQVVPAEPPSDYVQFVMEALGTVEVNAAGCRMVGVLSEARVLQMLEAFSFDIEATVNYFVQQRSGTKESADKKVVQKAPSKVSAVPHVEDSLNSKKKSQTAVSKASTAVGVQKKAPVDIEDPLSGLSIKDKSIAVSQNPKTVSSSSTAPGVNLITSSAPLSDDEYESTRNVKNPAAQVMPHITMVVAGHVDAGKSTLVGNLLLKVGNVAQRTMHKYEKESKLVGKGSFALAWVMDESESEREHGVTIDIAEKSLKTKSKSFTILDAPGHRDFIPNMISGAAQADTALLVIPASKGEYESSMSDGAQTREHAVLLKALGVSQIIVVVNKMDTLTPPWDHSRYSQIECELRCLLEELQFRPKAIRFVPLSGLTGENLVSLSESCPVRQWYNGCTLLEALDTFKDPTRRVDAPLRAVITSVISENAKGCEVSVSILQGTMRAGRGVGLASAAGSATVKRILDLSAESVSFLSAGQKGTVTLIDRSNRSGEEMSLREGMVLCKGPPLPCRTFKFKATLLTMENLLPPIIPGSTYELYLHGEVVQCCVTKLYSMAHPSTSSSSSSSSSSVRGKGSGPKSLRNVRALGGTTTSDVGEKNRIENPKCIPGGRCSKVKIEVTQSICIEPFKICDALGRFALRSKGKTCAVGICEKVKKIN